MYVQTKRLSSNPALQRLVSMNRMTSQDPVHRFRVRSDVVRSSNSQQVGVHLSLQTDLVFESRKEPGDCAAGLLTEGSGVRRWIQV